MEEEVITNEVVKVVESEEVDTQDKNEKTVPLSELQRRLAKEQEKHDKEIKALKANVKKEIEESKRLAKMNEDEKAKYELEQLQNELAELKRESTRNGLAKEASKMLSEHEISVDEDLLAFVVKDTAEDTQAAVNAFVGLINKKVEQGVKKALSGNTPKANVGQTQAMTQESFDKLGYLERLELKQKDPETYNKFTQ